MEMRPFGRLIPASDARRRLLAAVRPIRRTESISVERAFDRVSAQDVRAPRAVPTFARATWDGYALRSRDSRPANRGRPVELRVVGEVFAEQAFRGRLGKGEAVAIATGGAVPPGADAIVIFEEVERRSRRIRLRRPVAPGDRIAPVGDDFARGTLLVRKGEVLGPVALGALATCGLARVRVFARPRVALVPNGNELLRAGSAPRPGTIYESNNATLSAVIEAAGCEPWPVPPLPDDPRRIEAALRRAARNADLVLATGGSSVGERDYLPKLLPKVGRLLFHGIAVRPGKPTLAADTGRVLVVGLPGHPTSCLSNMYWLGLPLLRALARRPGPGSSEGWAVLGAEALAPTPGLATVVPLVFRRGRAFSAFRGSSPVTGLKGVRAFAMLSPGRSVVRAGTRLKVQYLDPPLGAPRPG